MTRFGAQLRSAGMSAEESAAKAALFEKLSHELALFRQGNPSPHFASFVPGRLEFLGKHTDYAGGRSIVCAIERGLCLVEARRAEAQIRILDVGRGSSLNFKLAPDLEPTAGHWSNFPMTVAARMARDFPEARCGADIVFTSDLPRASGMSSSSALVIAMFFALAEANSLWNKDAYRRAFPDREHLVGYVSAIESGASFASFSGGRGVGTQGGSEDHAAILCSRAGSLRQYSFCPIRLENEIRFPGDNALVIGVSGVKADKTGDARDAYNRASGATRKILELWRNANSRPNTDDDSSLATVLAQPGALERLRQIVRDSWDPDYSADILLKRLQQFTEETSEIVPQAAGALAHSNFEHLGALADRSQFLAETCLANQVPETIALAHSARPLGALAASAFGAGFGGSVWALIPAGSAEEFRQNWASQYHQRFPARTDASSFFIARPGPGLIQFA
ncbi:MAG TPA: galactokinase family protein [Candidatus Acidoferrales bacterium]|nr:galactokinase family protein [Candidatus Acidoferrales bacterium]